MTTSNLMYLYKIFHTFNVSCVGYKGIVISWPLVLLLESSGVASNDSIFSKYWRVATIQVSMVSWPKDHMTCYKNSVKLMRTRILNKLIHRSKHIETFK